eukprot:scaffold2782_cov182-Amphora_coffeaeformis.AAC.35
MSTPQRQRPKKNQPFETDRDDWRPGWMILLHFRPCAWSFLRQMCARTAIGLRMPTNWPSGRRRVRRQIG